MTDATIPLSKPYDPKKFRFPALVSEKWDGVPVRIDVDTRTNGHPHAVTIRSRQNKPVLSVSALVEDFTQRNINNLNCHDTITFIGEVVQLADPRADFKDTGGIVRRQYDQSDLLQIKVFDYWHDGIPYEHGIESRMDYFWDNYVFTEQFHACGIKHVVFNDQALQDVFAHHMAQFPNSEGMVARTCDATVLPGQRAWSYAKVLNEPTVDLRIEGFNEGQGKNAGAVGSFISTWRGVTVEPGAGKLTYKERKEIWENQEKYLGKIAKIKHKPGGGYDALRQPTFQCWSDKDEPDA